MHNIYSCFSSNDEYWTTSIQMPTKLFYFSTEAAPSSSSSSHCCCGLGFFPDFLPSTDPANTAIIIAARSEKITIHFILTVFVLEDYFKTKPESVIWLRISITSLFIRKLIAQIVFSYQIKNQSYAASHIAFTYSCTWNHEYWKQRQTKL